MLEKIIFMTKIMRFEPQIDRCIESIINQTHRNLEFYIICGVDTIDIVQNYALRDDRVKLFCYERSDSNDFYQVLEVVKSKKPDFFAWVDGDDWYEADFLEKTISYAKENALDLVIGAHREIGTDGNILNTIQLETNMIAETIKTKTWFIETWPFLTKMWGILYSFQTLCYVTSSSIPKSTEYGNRGSDTMLNYFILEHTSHFGILTDIVYNYQQTEHSHSVTLVDGRLKSSRTILNYVLNFLNNMGNKDLSNVYYLYIQYGCNVLDSILTVLIADISTEEKYKAIRFLLSQKENETLYVLTKNTRKDQFQNMYLRAILEDNDLFSNDQLYELVKLLYPKIDDIILKENVSYDNSAYIIDCKSRLVECMLNSKNDEKDTVMNYSKEYLIELVNKSDWDEADKQIDRYLEKHSFDADIAILKANIQIARGENSQAIDTLCKGLEFDANNYEVFFMLGNIYSDKQEYVQAEQCYEQARMKCTDALDKELISDTLHKNQLFVLKKELCACNSKINQQEKRMEEIFSLVRNSINYIQHFQNILPTYYNLKYELLDQERRYQPFYPKIISAEETLKKLAREKKSLARFGDGEFALASGISRCKFQEVDENLGKRIKEILVSDESELLVAIAKNYGALEEYTEDASDSIRLYMTESVREEHQKLLRKDKVYYDAYVSRPYIIYRDKFTEKPRERFDQWKQVWNNRNVIIVEGSETRVGVGNDLLENSADIKRILAPARNSFSRYNDILKVAADNGNKNSLFLIAMGPSAGVLAYDLSKLGYQAIDIGHLDLEYEWYLKKEGKRVLISGKYSNELEGGDCVEQVNDPLYRKQIIAELN